MQRKLAISYTESHMWSILRPLLFLIYVNDMAGALDEKLLLYADDSAILVSDKMLLTLSHCCRKSLQL